MKLATRRSIISDGQGSVRKASASTDQPCTVHSSDRSLLLCARRSDRAWFAFSFLFRSYASVTGATMLSSTMVHLYRRYSSRYRNGSAMRASQKLSVRLQPRNIRATPHVSFVPESVPVSVSACRYVRASDRLKEDEGGEGVLVQAGCEERVSAWRRRSAPFVGPKQKRAIPSSLAWPPEY